MNVSQNYAFYIQFFFFYLLEFAERGDNTTEYIMNSLYWKLFIFVFLFIHYTRILGEIEVKDGTTLVKLSIVF